MAEPDAVPQKSRAGRIADPKKCPHPPTMFEGAGTNLFGTPTIRSLFPTWVLGQVGVGGY